MSVHYKFKSGKEKHSVVFDGLHISVSDLKKAILEQRKIGKNRDLDLQISSTQTGKVYETDSTLIPKNTSVEVARVPNSDNQKKFRDRQENNLLNGTKSATHIEVDNITKSSNLSTSYGTEDEKIKAMMSQSTQEYDPSKYTKNRGIVGPLPSNYICHRCGQRGHYIKYCPTNNSDVKRSTGIPRSFMIPAKADQKGALLTATGDYAVPIIDHDAYKEVKKEKPPFLLNNDSDKEVVLPEIPEDLKCIICQDLLQDAVLIPCCGNSYCDECVRIVLLESENHECPTCHEVNVSPDTLIPNRFLRISVNAFKNKIQYKKDIVINENKNYETKQSQNETNDQKIDNKDVIETNSDLVRMKSQMSPRESKSPIENSCDVTLDEEILGSPQKEKLTKKQDEPQPVIKPMVLSNEVHSEDLEENNDDSNVESNDSQQETATDSNTPLIDEPLKSFETTEEKSIETGVNTISTLHNNQNQPLLTMPICARPPRMDSQIRAIQTVGPQQSNPTPILPHPRSAYPRPGFTGEMRFYRPMADPRAFHMGLTQVPPYGFAPQFMPQAYHNPYGYIVPRSHLPTHFTLRPAITEAPPGTVPLITDKIYPYSKPEYDDYEDRLNRFTHYLESKRRAYQISSRDRSKDRSRSRDRKSLKSRDESKHRSHKKSRRSRSRSSSRKRSHHKREHKKKSNPKSNSTSTKRSK